MRVCVCVVHKHWWRWNTNIAVYFRIPVWEHRGPCPALVRANPHQNGKPVPGNKLLTKAKQKGSCRSLMSHLHVVDDDWTWDPDQHCPSQILCSRKERQRELRLMHSVELLREQWWSTTPAKLQELLHAPCLMACKCHWLSSSSDNVWHLRNLNHFAFGDAVPPLW